MTLITYLKMVEIGRWSLNKQKLIKLITAIIEESTLNQRIDDVE